jgi:hypothetical protein
MNCPKCNAENLVGTFCTVCGAQLSGALNPAMGSNLADSNPLNSESIPPSKTKSKQLVLGAVLIASLLAGLGFYFFTKESPAAPQLRALCSILEPIDFTKTSSNDKGDLLAKIQPILAKAKAADPEATLPFTEINQDMEKAKSDSDESNEKMAYYLVFDDVSSLFEANALLDLVIASGEKTETDIGIACVDYKS